MNLLGTVKGWAVAAKAFAVVNSPYILVGAGIVGAGIAIYHAWHNGKKAKEVITEKTIEKGEKLTKKETWDCTWKLLVPVIAEFVLSSGCIIFGMVIEAKRLAELAAVAEAALAARNQAQKELDYILDKHPECKKTLEEIQKSPLINTNVIPHSSFGGTDIFYDPLTKLTWIGDYKQHQTAIALFQEAFFKTGYATTEELFERFGLRRETDIPLNTALLAWNESDRDNNDDYDLNECGRKVPNISFIPRPLRNSEGKVIPNKTMYMLIYFPSGESFELDKESIMRRLPLQVDAFESALDCYSELDEIKRMKAAGCAI